ncbi:DUF4861 domain-containing protein [Wenyingzhuangia sp. IMCC45467]
MKKSVKVISSIALTTLLFVSCKTANQTNIVLSNTSNFDLKDKPISIERNSLSVDINNAKKHPLVTINTDTIPSQLIDVDDNGVWDELFFVTDFSSQEVKTVLLSWVDEVPNYKIRTSARFGKRMAKDSVVKPALQEVLMANELPKSLGYQQYQTDGPSWENDKVGFRHYLDGRNAKDLFGKKTTKMSPENVGINDKGAVEDNYHVMEFWGRDILSVGNSVGLGGYALIQEDNLLRLGVTVNDSVNNVERTTFKIQTEGPVTSVLTYDYQNWKPSLHQYSVHEKTTIWPGMYGYKNTVSVTGLQGDEHLAVGLVNINNNKPLHVLKENDDFVVLYTHDKQTYNKEWWLGMAIILPKKLYIGYIDAPDTGNLSKTYLAKLKIENNKPVSYYAVAGWEISDERFKDEAFFKSYVIDLTNQLSAKINVEINN